MNPCPCGYHGDPVKECTCSLCDKIETSRRTARDELSPAHPSGAPHLAEAIRYRPRRMV